MVATCWYWLQQWPPPSMAARYLVNIFEPANTEEFLRICPQQHRFLWVQQGHPHNIHSKSPHILFYPLVPLPQPSGYNQRCRAEGSSAPKSLNIPSGPSSHSMTSILRGWLSGSFATPHMPSPHLFQVLFYGFFLCHLLFDCVRQINCPPWE